MTYDLKILDFENIRRALIKNASTPYGEESITHLEPAPNINIARTMQASVSAARRCVDANNLLTLGEVPNIRVALRQASSTGSALNTNALFNISQVLKAGNALAKLIEDEAGLYPDTMPGLSIPRQLLDKIEATVTQTGRLRGDASPKLKTLNQEMKSLRQQAEDVIKAYCADQNIKQFLVANKKVLWHGERAVVAVLSQHLDKIKGVIKGSQSGGMEQLVEPLVSLAINNSIERLSQEIIAEQQIILRSVTDIVREYIKNLDVLIDAIAWVDIAFAAGALSAHMNGHEPRLVEEPYIELRQAYHPTLLIQFLQGKLEAPVPLSITIEKSRPYILITGPNTGGKTVVLKTVGLLQLMAQCGLHIPAEENCTLGWFDTIMVDMGDKQSMYHQLSTFAGHVEVMKEILSNANEKSLFLLDELGTGTDPEEGAALAMAMIDQLIQQKSMGIVNTHLSPLKPYAENHSQIVNAAMQFDDKTLSPTYRLEVGVNGESFGLVIAERNGLPSSIVENAAQYLHKLRKIS